jgi:hypothetical protein
MPRHTEGDSRQEPLPFGEAEGSFQERKELLGLALLKARADIYLAQFALWVFNATHGGVSGALKRTYADLAAAPWGLCCGKTKARETVETARRIGIVAITETRLADGGRGANEYTIDWLGIREVTGFETVMGAATRHRGAATRHRGAATRHAYKEQHLPDTSESETESESGAPRPRMVGDDSRHERAPRMVRVTDEAWLDEVPELREARMRRIAPLPPADLRYGAFRVIRRYDALTNGSLVIWFRRQLGVVRPITGDSEADLLLVLAAGLAAAAVPQAEVQKNRLAIFGSTVGRGLWGKILHHVPAARKLLDQVLLMYPECLTHADELGPRAEGAGQAADYVYADGFPQEGATS